MIIYQSYTDAELLLLIQQNDEAAFRVLYERYWKKLLTQAYFKLQSAEDAEEIVQTIFINLWRRRQTIQLKHSFHTYVASMLKYEVLHKLLLHKRDQKNKADVPWLQVVEDDSTCQWLDYEQLRSEMEKEIQRLPEKCQLVFRLSREAGLSEKQIGQVMGIAPKTVQAHMGKALKQLRTSVQRLLYMVY
ncbi:RNA polymerase sigma factor [Paraflavitalea speifideaquila]|uniref:RNA polymerase sigma factor n=1 Tax=Paraflavitalea speifideaquila TaxID=3076558 RepID=UPI0028EE1437|nr:sigma-70 family RNA polymerase sigma factor [Paraflavitalea speifideiaquila]